jgi:DNA-damage-inducible protein J
MLQKAATINARIEPEVKHQAEIILHKVGLTSAEAIRLFYKQICLRKGLPFVIEIPNKKTRDAMRDADLGRTNKAKNVDELFEDLE